MTGCTCLFYQSFFTVVLYSLAAFSAFSFFSAKITHIQTVAEAVLRYFSSIAWTVDLYLILKKTKDGFYHSCSI